MQDLGALSDEMTPVIADLGDAAPDLNRFILALGPFSRQAKPVARQPRRRARDRRPGAAATPSRCSGTCATSRRTRTRSSRDLASLVTSFDETGGIERLMDYIFFQVTAINGFDSLSHYLRAGLLASAACSRYQITVAFGCESTFGPAEVEGASARRGERADPVAHRGQPTAPRTPTEADDADSLKDDIERITRIEDPEIVKEREAASSSEIREGAESPPKGPYGDAQPFLDYLLGNDE